MTQNRLIYLDHAATAPMRPAALEAMTAALRSTWGNAMQTYPYGQQAKAALDMARTTLAETIHADWHEIFLTSGGTESDNWALIGTAEAYQNKGKHIIVSSIEHHAILHTCDYLESRGFEITTLPVNHEGLVDPKELASVLDSRPDTILVSVMWANNEVGTVEPIETLCKYTHDHGALFHTDAVQAYGKLPIDVSKVPVDMLSVSAHKIGGPKGIGFLYIRKGVQPQSLIHGGGQESGRRAGTENVPAAVGFAAAAREAAEKMPEEQAREAELQLYFYQQLMANFPDALWNGPLPVGAVQNGSHGASLLQDRANRTQNEANRTQNEANRTLNGVNRPKDGAILEERPQSRRLANNLSVSFPGIRADAMLMNLDLAGICASGGSACTTGALDPSHVIMALSGDAARARSTIRFTLGPENTKEEIDRTIDVLKETLGRLAQ